MFRDYQGSRSLIKHSRLHVTICDKEITENKHENQDCVRNKMSIVIVICFKTYFPSVMTKDQVSPEVSWPYTWTKYIQRKAPAQNKKPIIQNGYGIFLNRSLVDVFSLMSWPLITLSNFSYWQYCKPYNLVSWTCQALLQTVFSEVSNPTACGP